MPRGDDDMLVEGWDRRELLPENRWFDGHYTMFIFNTSQVLLQFTIVEAGDYFEKQVVMPFRIKRLGGRLGKNGKFVLSAGGDMYALITRLLDVKQRRDRISLLGLKHIALRAKFRTVTQNRLQKPLPEDLRYSVAEEIERG